MPRGKVPSKLPYRWSARLGLALSPLLDSSHDEEQFHFAMLDGVDASFALSTASVDARIALDWAWSAQLANHVDVRDDVVLVRQVDPRAKIMRFDRPAVDEHLDRFLETIISKRIAPAVSVVDHVVGCFRSHRHVARQAGLSKQDELRSFLTLIENAIQPDIRPDRWGLPETHSERLVEELSYNTLVGRSADLALTMRHAAGMVFQETHAELSTETLSPQLFGLPPTAQQSTRNALGAYYTPPGLARTLADLAVRPHLGKAQLSILDPACGSGIFLNEVLRALQRHAYTGAVSLHGIDISADAIEMAKFALKYNDAAEKAKISLNVGSFVTSPKVGEFDIVLMNPPFVAFQDLPDETREIVKATLGSSYAYRPDFSVLFVELALSCLKEGGTLASLVPAGILTQRSILNWRSHILEANSVDLIAVLGDHGLFRDAMVNIAALILQKTKAESPMTSTMLWASQKHGASATALRRLRRWSDGDRRAERTKEWSIYSVPEGRLIQLGDWLPRPNHLGTLPERIRENSGVTAVTRLFDIELGIRSGNRATYVIGKGLFDALPKREQKYFRPIAEKGSIKAGSIRAANYLFYPDRPMRVSEVRESLPNYSKKVAAIAALKASDVMELARARRSTMNSFEPRIVSRAFIGSQSFAVDSDGSHVVVQGYSWLPTEELTASEFDLVQLLSDYCFILNSRLFFLLLREFGRIVAGGQVDGSKQNLRNVPLPNLAIRYLEDSKLRRMAEKLRVLNQRQYPRVELLDEFAALAFGTDIQEWPSQQ